MTRKLLNAIREWSVVRSDDKRTIIKESNDLNPHDGNGFKITKSTQFFGDVRVSQEESIIKTIGESVEMDDNSLVFYGGSDNDLVLTAKIPSINIVFQFRSNDKDGEGCYVWANSLRLSEKNVRTVGMIRNAFTNWKNNLIENGDLIEKLKKASEKNEKEND